MLSRRAHKRLRSLTLPASVLQTWPRAAGPCAAVVGQDSTAIALLEATHADCLRRNAALVVIAEGGCNLLLAPVKTDPSEHCLRLDVATCCSTASSSPRNPSRTPIVSSRRHLQLWHRNPNPDRRSSGWAQTATWAQTLTAQLSAMLTTVPDHGQEVRASCSTAARLSADHETRCGWWAFCATRQAPALCQQLLATCRLPVVFDLDDCLVVAFSMTTLGNEIRKAQELR